MSCSTGTVPFADILYKASGRFFNDISLISIVTFDFESANLARIAYGHLLYEYKMGYARVDFN